MYRYFNCFKKSKVVVVIESDSNIQQDNDVQQHNIDSLQEIVENTIRETNDDLEQINNTVKDSLEDIKETTQEVTKEVSKEVSKEVNNVLEDVNDMVEESVDTVGNTLKEAAKQPVSIHITTNMNEDNDDELIGDVVVDNLPLSDGPKESVRPGTPIPGKSVNVGKHGVEDSSKE